MGGSSPGDDCSCFRLTESGALIGLLESRDRFAREAVLSAGVFFLLDLEAEWEGIYAVELKG